MNELQVFVRRFSVPVPAATPPTSTSPPQGAELPTWTVESLQGWHLPLLDDPAFLPLQPLLQRSLLLAVPEKLITAVALRQPLASQVLVALQRDPSGGSQALGLAVSRRLNRRGSCWQLEHLCLALNCGEGPRAPARRDVSMALVREAINRGRGAASWITVVPSLDTPRLATLRELGFQPQRTDRLWLWQPAALPSSPRDPDLILRRLDRGSAPLLWHLEQAACPAPLRQLLDRRIEDLLDHSHGRGWMLIDRARNEAVLGARCQADHPAGGPVIELSVHPGWSHLLLGGAAELLLQRLAGETASGGRLWIPCEEGDACRQAWLVRHGAEPRGEQVLMARSVWRRQTWQTTPQVASRLSAVLERLQPRRRPLPTPVGPQPLAPR
ncbi:MAG: hypothetical protein ACKN89_02055 [Cyanobium sp.]|jgi:hypothetical protein|nr:hypothetical protein [Synechococcaceae cyanobacterium]